MPEIKTTWKNHPLCKQGLVELVPTDWVWRYRGTDVSPAAELADGTPVNLDQLWENIRLEGLREPLVMRVGLKTGKFRLEAGNHRIQVLRDHGIDRVPLVVQIREDCGPYLADAQNDGTHNFAAAGELLITETTREYLKPSQVFRSLKL